MQFTCKLCGELVDGSPLVHYRTAHPGEKSPAPSHKKRKEASSSPSSAAAAVPGDSTAADDPNLFSNEVPPDLPPDIEAAPVEPAKKRLRDRIFGGSGDAVVSRGTSRELRPSRKRENGADFLALCWGGLGWGLIKSGADDAVGRVLQFQAPMAGEVLDKLVAGTVVDRALVQPVARNMDQAEAASALFALPMLVFMWERMGPEGRVMLYPLMQEAVRANFVAMVPVLKKKKAESAKFERAVADMKDEGLIPPDVDASDAVDAMLAGMLNGVMETEPAANGQGVTDDSLAR